MMKTLIALDAGHGGSDPGAIGLNGLQEKEVTLAITKELNAALKANGVPTYMTRSRDETLGLLTRSACINNMRSGLSVSVHCNASANRNADYISTYIQAAGGEAEQLARTVQAQLVAATGWTDGGIKEANLHMNREVNCPSILVECGFISNPAQEQQLADPATRRNIALAIAKGALSYIGVKEVYSMTIEEAISVLRSSGVITSDASAEYWKKAPEYEKYIDALLINMAKYIAKEA